MLPGEEEARQGERKRGKCFQVKCRQERWKEKGKEWEKRKREGEGKRGGKEI